MKLLPIFDTPNNNAILLVMLTLLTPLFVKVTSPVNTLFCVKVIGWPLALIVVVPGTVNTPVWVIAPVPPLVVFITKLLPMLEAANTKSMLLVMLTLFNPLLLKVTAPVNALVCVNVIGLAPALKFEVPATVAMPA